jgi:hypothetical protein
MLLLTLEDVVQSLLNNYWTIAQEQPFIIGEIYCEVSASLHDPADT